MITAMVIKFTTREVTNRTINTKFTLELSLVFVVPQIGHSATVTICGAKMYLKL